jgi:bacteriocin-like protein
MTDEELAAVYGGVKSKGEGMCELTEECEQSQSRVA